jgi:3D-(3,5/4)-trihydroxycyclohexane-1,2-dione acylhydrolase (decyclizing)
MTTTVMEETISQKKETTIRLSASQALIRYLSAQKTECFDGTIAPLIGGVFGIFGHGNVAGIGEALSQYKDVMPYYRGQNEQGIAHAAIAYAKAHRCRKLMGVTSSIGPGATNLLTAAALAHVNNLPVLLLPGDVFASRRPDPVLQQLEDPSSPLITANSAFQAVSRYYDVITRPEQLLSSLPQAIRILTSIVDRGPAVIALPQDVQAEAYDYPLSFFEEKIHMINRPEADTRSLERSAKIFMSAKKPMIIAGGGVHYSGAVEVLRGFAKRHGIPIAETQAGKGVLPWDDSLCLGGLGVTGTSAANHTAQEADLVLCVGTRLSDFTTASKTLFKNPEVQFIGLNAKSFDAEKMNSTPLIADAARGLESLSGLLGTYSSSISYQEDCHTQIKEWWNFASKLGKPEKNSLSTDAQVLTAVNEVIDKDAILVAAAGGLPGELHKLWKTSAATDAYHLEYGYSCMGYEIAGGLGVKMAKPEREVYVLLGDGSYLMLHTELLTARLLGIKINVIVCDNKGYGCINRLQQACGSASFGNLLEDNQGDQVDVDFAANARSYGCHANKVESIDELKDQLKKNRSRSETCVTIIDTDPNVSTAGTAWWDVAISESSNNPTVKQAREEYIKKLEDISQ